MSSETGWHINPVTLREVVDDRRRLEEKLSTAGPADRVWLLRLLGRPEDAVEEGRRVLGDADDRFRPLLLLAHAHQWLGQWHDAETLQAVALAGAVGTAREAVARQHIGKRLFDQQRYDEAAEQFEAALALRLQHRADPDLVESSRTSLHRACELRAHERR